MSKLNHVLLFVGIGVVACAILAVLMKIWFGRKTDPVPPVQSTKVDQDALAAASQALLDRAKAQAQSDAQKQKIADIEKIQDPAEKLKQLSDMLKGV